MKKLFFAFLPLIFLGIGCLNNSSTSTSADGGIFKTVDTGENWSQVVAVPTAKGMGTLATTNVLNLEMDPQNTKFLYASTRNNGMLYSDDAAQSWYQPKQAILTEGTVYDVEVDPKNVCTVYMVTERKLVSTNDCMRTLNEEVYLENRAQVGTLKVSLDWFNTNILWLGLSNGDVVKSENKGGNWRTILTMGAEISEILLSNTDTRQVLVSTFNGTIQRTIDGGDSWQLVTFPKAFAPGSIYNLIQNPDSSVVIAVTQYGLLRSRDFGQTWEAIPLLTAPSQVMIRSAAIDPKDSNRLSYATPGTFYHSVDGGVTWKTRKFQTSRDARVMLVDPKDSSVLYIGVASATQ